MGDSESRVRTATSGWSGALAVVGGFLTGFAVWGLGAAPGLRGTFENERDLSLLYVDLPLTLFGTPALALGAWALVARTRAGRGREGRAALAVVAALALAAWGGTEWLQLRTAAFVRTEAW
ncbi:hypothetical protein [Streptomyces sp. NRRL F-5135]|uniref:hypothetical protein n=1 Tax=Streptomyces sp. NRRL F-5135 TaxID=1463858 RepID=UPI0006920ADF|nr:hypothetical protein [Streptomyces sp. NRRL F-5135]